MDFLLSGFFFVWGGIFFLFNDKFTFITFFVTMPAQIKAAMKLTLLIDTKVWSIHHLQ